MIKKYYSEFFKGKISEKEYWKRCMRDLGIRKDYKKLRKVLLESFNLNKEVAELVKDLRKNYQVGLLSDQTKERYSYLNRKFNIEEKFDFTVISFREGLRKPQTKIYEVAVQKTGSEPENCIYIDDLKHNLSPAEELGIKTIHYRNNEQLKQDLKMLGVNF